MKTGFLKKKKIGRWLIAASAVAFVVFFLSGSQGLIAIYLSQRSLRAARKEIAALRVQIDSLSQEIKRLQSDTGYLDHIARQHLGMAQKGERVYKFVEEKK